MSNKKINRFFLGIIGVFLLLLIFNSCRTITITEFKSQFDWDESIASVKDFGHNQIFVEFKKADKNYIVPIFDYPSGVRIGYKYIIIFDKKDPEDNYLVLFQEPIKPNPIPTIEIQGKINSIEVCTNYILVKYNGFYKLENGLIKEFTNVEALPLDMEKKCLQFINNNSCVVIELFLLPSQGVDNQNSYQPFISIDKLCNGNNVKKD
ncbi:MAG TPA: hypothetical protein P5531_14850 [Bacteroidales bacterium]|nr:hypothetical protein [Bacteroidales bacterium]HSA44852.1 hypothetical protein [Bacteroidales bacterium]